MVNLFSITCTATTFLRDRITKNNQKHPKKSYFCMKKFNAIYYNTDKSIMIEKKIFLKNLTRT